MKQRFFSIIEMIKKYFIVIVLIVALSTVIFYLILNNNQAPVKERLTIYSPENKTYNSNVIFFNVSSTELAGSISHSFDNGKGIIECERCLGYAFSFPMKQGSHIFRVYGYFNDSKIIKKEVVFTIKIPRSNT